MSTRLRQLTTDFTSSVRQFQTTLQSVSGEWTDTKAQQFAEKIVTPVNRNAEGIISSSEELIRIAQSIQHALTISDADE